MRLLLTDQDKARRAVEPELREKFNVIARKIRVKGLFREKVSTDQTEIDFSEDDLSASLTRIAPSKQILGYYSEHAVELAFEEFGIFPALRERGFRNLRLMIDPSDPDHQLLRVYGKKESEDRQNNEDELLVELLVHRLTIEAPQSPHFLEDRLIRLLAVEWLSLKNPSSNFSEEKPKLPGQEHPGLGIAEHIQELLVQVCNDMSLDGIHSIPSYYHNAIIESRWFRFLDPGIEGKILAMKHVLSRFNLAASSKLVASGALSLKDGTPVVWSPSDHILPVSSRIAEYFESKPYLHSTSQACSHLLNRGLHFTLKPLL